MKKYILIFLILIFIVEVSFSKPFISTQPSKRTEYFQVIIENNLTKETITKVFYPQTDDSLIIDVPKDLELSSEDDSFKIIIVSTNSSGDSGKTSFNLIVSKIGQIIEYKIEPIPEEDNPDYMKKFVEDSLIVSLPDFDGDDNENKGCFLKTIM